jgi:hypothetical protein
MVAGVQFETAEVGKHGASSRILAMHPLSKENRLSNVVELVVAPM